MAGQGKGLPYSEVGRTKKYVLGHCLNKTVKSTPKLRLPMLNSVCAQCADRKTVNQLTLTNTLKAHHTMGTKRGIGHPAGTKT